MFVPSRNSDRIPGLPELPGLKVLGMASTDEETGLKSGEKSEDQDLDPDRDPELKKNGGRFDSKKAILQVTWRFGWNEKSEGLEP
ncbi:unnamed protein product [Cladocopium goreaui]|uniref:Uncharacterized protein n=1 Tax=Cladocopium goreaui TaxID=2562237 RepID=A0A9P1FJI7_9DINO|nr:unnamed protein product [Cladocopium goreaui]